MNKVIKKVLMCEPRYFEVSYSINPWMRVGSVNKKRACRQWSELLGVFGKLEIKVEVIEQKKGLPDMVFCADQGVVKNQELLLSNFRYQQRQKETEIYQKWFKNNNFSVNKLPEGVFFEGGGEALWFGRKLFVGTGFRGNLETAGKIRGIWKDTEIIPLKLINPYFYHLDTCLFVLNKETIFYYPSAFSLTSQSLLKKITPNLIPISPKEAFNFAANGVVTDHHIVLQKNNIEMMRELDSLGYCSIETDVSEFMKAGGGIHCLTSVIKEEE